MGSSSTSGTTSARGGGTSTDSAAAGGAAATSGGGAAGFALLTRRGGGSDGAVGRGGSGAFPGLRPFTATGVSANDAFDGTAMFRCRASRSTNWRATTSSMVLEALFTSMP
jgi:hypothetical protein